MKKNIIYFEQYWWAVLGLIFMMGLFLRVYQLGSVPPGFWLDEASVGVNAQSIAHQGMDEHGRSWPGYFESFGEYKNPVYIYITAIFVKFFGLSELMIRLPNAFLSSLTIIAFYYLGRAMGQRKIFALIGAAVLAVLPWHFHFSRVGMDGSSFFLFFWVLGVVACLRFNQQASWRVGVSMVCMFIATFYSYSTMRLYVPLFLLGLGIYWWGTKPELRRKIVLLGMLFVLLLAPFMMSIHKFPLGERFYEVSILSESHPILRFIINYTSYFSPTYLFLVGDNNERHGVIGVGVLYWALAPVLIYGFIQLVLRFLHHEKNSHTRYIYFLVLWATLLYPLAASLTNQGVPHAIRSIVGIPILVIISIFGVQFFIEAYQHKAMRKASITMVLLAVLFVIEAGFYMQHYFYEYPRYAWPVWQYGYKDTYNQIAQTHYDYTFVAFSNLISLNNPIFADFYLNEYEDIRHKISYEWRSYRDYFEENTLYIVTPSDIVNLADKNIVFKTQFIIYDPNGQELWYGISR